MINRYFTKDADFGYKVYDSFEWKKVDVKLTDYATGETIYKGYDLEFPEHYSQQACDIIASKYFFRNIDGKGTPETSLRQVIHRMVRFWTDALIDEGLINGYRVVDQNYNFDESIEENCSNFFTGEANVFYDECVYTLLKQMWAPNSPQWFNTGIKYYGVKGEPDDLYYYDKGTAKVVKSKDRYTRSQTSACFIIPITDHLLGKNSITDHFVTETKLFKGGSGVGTNFSPVRAEGEALSNGGHSSGVMSFLLGLDRNAGAIKSGGTTRRAAKMVILDIDHPDIEDFIDWKVHEEKKARDLISLGYDGSMNGEAYQTVSGQNSNNSVRVTDKFMKKVTGEDPFPRFELRGRKDLNVDKVVNAKDLWDKICTAAWECADPGIQFDDTYNEWNTVPNAGRINATNPCSEFAFIDNSACNLASINVAKFISKTDNAKWFENSDFLVIVHLIQYVLEASIHWGQFPTEEVALNSYLYRPTGLGICNLASLFLELAYPYDSDAARNLAGFICSMMTAQSYLTSVQIANKIGACKGYEDNAESLEKVIKKHLDAVTDNIPEVSKDLFGDVLNYLTDCGVRNMQTTVLAPTGTISLAMDCAATGIEPFFSHKVFKKCSDGSVMEMTNPLIEEYIHKPEWWNLLKKDDHNDMVDSIEDYFDDHNTYQGCPYLQKEAQKILETANEISPKAHVKMMAAMQPFISGSISKTVNLPNDATKEDISDIYIYAWESGCKSISVYRNGSKGTQPLVTAMEIDEEDDDAITLDLEINDEDEELTQVKEDAMAIELQNESERVLEGVTEFKAFKTMELDGEYVPVIDQDEIVEKDLQHVMVTNVIRRNKPDGVRKGCTHTAKIGGVELYVTVSYYEDGSLCEIFVSSDKEGTTTKGLLSSLSKSLSHMLQYGIEPDKIAAILRNQQYEPAGHVERHPYIKMCSSISDFIARVIEYECGDYSRIQVKPNEDINTDEQTIILNGWEGKSIDELRESDGETYSGEIIRYVDGVSKPINDVKYYAVKIEDTENYDGVYTGNECQICHSNRMVKNGNCEVCLDCGSTSGCS